MSMFTVGLAVVLAALRGLPAAAESPPGGDLIQVDVQVLEINKSKLYKVGLDWARLLEGGAAGAASAAAGGPVSPAELVEDAPPPLRKLGTFSRGQVDAFMRLLEGNNYGRLLAKPKLLTVSGSPATFLVGGEIPVVSQDTQGHGCVSYLS
ncbi:MAG: hypothetical protein AAB152_12220 [Candidatus Coatesbacteria bacterium]